MQNDGQRVPVTALAFFQRRFILAGEGQRIKIYNAQNETLLKDVRVFERQAIHGITALDEQTTFLVWGGALVRCLTLNEVPGKDGDIDIRLESTRTVDDWILDAAFAPSLLGEPPCAAVVTAHSALTLVSLSFRDGDVNISKVQQAVAGSNCILYAAHIKWLGPSRCLVASGTAFGDVILWSTELVRSSERSRAEVQTHYTFSAHEGSVFGVQLSSMLNIPGIDGETQLLASCSDDRTIRLWNVTDLDVNSPTIGEVQRDTGFGTRTDRAPGAPELLAQTMGHISRIWKVHFVQSQEPPTVSIMSFGEDAASIEWQLSQSPLDSKSLPYTLKQVKAITAHTGKNIWSTAVDHSSGCIATGGADGAIALRHPLFSMSDIQEIPRFNQCSDKTVDNYRSYCFLDSSRILSTTDHGAVVLVDLDAPCDDQLFQISPPLSSLRGYSIVASVRGTAWVAGADGAVYVYTTDRRDLCQIYQAERKVAGLFACAQDDESVGLLITTVGASSATLMLADDTNLTSEAEGYRSMRLSLPSGFIVTSFTCLQSADSIDIVLGSRNGSLALFSVKCSESMELLDPLLVSIQVHGKEAVTALTLKTHARDGITDNWLFSTGRDSTFAVHNIHRTGATIDLRLVHQLALPFGPNIEGFDLATPDVLLVWGFKSKEFIVYDVVAQREIMTVECGGAHRTWAFQPTPGGGRYVWTKASALYQTTQDRLVYRLINGGGHGREIKATAVAPHALASGDQLLATGAEDTNIKIWVRHRDGSQRCLHTLRKHNTGIQHLEWSADGQRLFSSGGFEEFYVWKVSHGVPQLDVGVSCESTHPRSGGSDLRITSFDVHSTSTTTADGQGSYIISMAYSDSTLKQWRYQSPGFSTNATTHQLWTLVASGDYLTACLTQTRRLCFSTSSELMSPHLLTASTDGHIALWRAPSLDNPITNGEAGVLHWSHHHRVHQSAILAWDTYTLPFRSNQAAANAASSTSTTTTTTTTTIIATGGDDNAIGLTLLQTTHTGELVLPVQTLLIPRAHAAAVTGIALFPLPASEPGKGVKIGLLSVGLDQLVRKWSFEGGREDGIDEWSVSRHDDDGEAGMSAVADVSGLEVCSRGSTTTTTAATCEEEDGGGGEERVLVCGVGMEGWRVRW